MTGLALYVAYRAATAVFGAMPEPMARRIGLGLGWMASFLSPGRLALVKRHLARVVGDERATTGLARRMFASYGRYWAEIFWVTPQRRDQLLAHSHVEGADRVTAAAATGTGVILALPHVGNWEAAGPWAKELGVPVLAAAEALPNRRIVDWFVATRAKLGIEVVIAGRDRSATARLIERLRQGGAIALVADRDISGKGVPVEFFGDRTSMPAGPVALADRTGATLLPVACFFRHGRGHRFVVEAPIVIPELPSREARIAAGTQAFARALEGLIRQAPEQWHLFQPNWPGDRQAQP